MCKRIFAVVVFILCVSLSAADIKDTWFETLYDGVTRTLPRTCQARKNPENRILFIDFPLQINSSNSFNIPAAKAAIVKAVRGTQDAELIRKADITVIYNYITTDRKIYSVVITAKDL